MTVPEADIIRLDELLNGGYLVEADAYAEKLLPKFPLDKNLLLKKIQISYFLGNMHSALEYIDKMPGHESNAQLVSLSASVLKNSGRKSEAIENYKKAIAIEPGNYVHLYNFGVFLAGEEQNEEAEKYFRKCLELVPEFPQANYNLGNLMRIKNRFEEARLFYECALKSDPGFEDALYNLGVVLEELQDYDASEEAYLKVLGMNPSNIKARWNLSLLQLLKKDYLTGFANYEARLKKSDFQRKYSFTRWDGSSLKGKRLLVYTEQGFGDAVMFLRFLPYIEKSGAEITLEVRPELEKLFSESTGVKVIAREKLAELISSGSSAVCFDYEIPLMSLPYVYKLSAALIPAEIPYIKTEYKLPESFSSIIKDKRLKAGIVWKGNPTHIRDAKRSLNLKDLIPLLAIDGIRFISLQNAVSKEDIFRETGFDEIDVYADSFEEITAVVKHLDVVISVDTAVAHIAAASGCLTFILIPGNPDWRWGTDGTTSLWYPSARLFREKNNAGLGNVIEEIKTEIMKMADARRNDYYNSGLADFRKRQFNAAFENFIKVPETDGNYYLAQNYAGVIKGMQRYWGEALDFFRRSIEVKPDFPDTYINTAIVLSEAGEQKEAGEFYGYALKLNPGNAAAWFNYGVFKQETGMIGEAADCYKRALELKPDYASAGFNLSLMHFMSGNYKEGYKLYHWGFLTGDRVKRDLPGKEWKGENPAGKRIYVYSDQGFGDTIHFVRFLPMLKKMGAEVILEVHPKLMNLLYKIEGADEIYPSNGSFTAATNYDYHIPLLSFPEFLELTPERIPDGRLNLSIDPEKTEYWKQRIESDKKKIAFVWSGNPDFPKNHKRAASFKEFSSIITEKFDFYCLQFNKDKSYTGEFSQVGIKDYTSELSDFADTAAFLKNMDLLISVDTGIVHLAGAMGFPARVLLWYVPDWRWGISGEKCSLYESLTLIRQPVAGDWNSVFKKVFIELNEKIE